MVIPWAGEERENGLAWRSTAVEAFNSACRFGQARRSGEQQRATALSSEPSHDQGTVRQAAANDTSAKLWGRLTALLQESSRRVLRRLPDVNLQGPVVWTALPEQM